MSYHGGDIYQLDKKVIDFSSNINPLGVPESFKQQLQINVDDFINYPDREYLELKGAIKRYTGCRSTSNIVVGNGAVELIYQSIKAIPCNKVYTLSPTFSEYRRASKLADKAFVEIPAFYNDYTKVDRELILETIEQHSIVILCNPNNPTGTLLSRNEMIEIVTELSKINCYLIVDEAFMDFTDNYPNHSMTSEIENYHNLVVIKAATKFFGMPGIRLGYLLSNNHEMISNIQSRLEPWNVNTTAVIAGTCIFNDVDYINYSNEWIKKERPRLYRALNDIKGLKVYPSSANYHLVCSELQQLDAWKLSERLLQYNILIRVPEGFHHLTKYHFRLAVKSEDENNKLIHALREVFDENELVL